MGAEEHVFTNPDIFVSSSLISKKCLEIHATGPVPVTTVPATNTRAGKARGRNLPNKNEAFASLDKNKADVAAAAAGALNGFPQPCELHGGQPHSLVKGDSAIVGGKSLEPMDEEWHQKYAFIIGLLRKPHCVLLKESL